MVEAIDPYLLLNAAAQLFGKAPAELEEAEWRQAVELAGKESLLQQKILASDEAAGIGITDGELTAAMASVEARYAERREFLEELARNGMNEKTLAESLQASLKVEKCMESVAGSVTLDDSEVEAFYRDNKDKFERPELREARHILITINDAYKENRPKAVKERLGKIAAELQQKPEAFADLALRHSECPTALEGGYLGKLPKGKLYPALDAALFEMAEGEISKPLKSPIGLHILLCEKIHAAGIAPLAEAADSIRDHLLAPRRRAAQKQWIRALLLPTTGREAG